MADDNSKNENENYRSLWNGLAQHDPLWAVLSFDDKRNRQWDLREFMKLGEREIALAVHRCDELGYPVAAAQALDFGCGVGRLTQALARRFDKAVGVDISDEMIALANRLNQYPDCAEHVRLDATGLKRFPSEQFDFVYSSIVLQHIPPDGAIGCVREFMRLLRPGGMAVFQLPSHRVEISSVETKPMADHGYQATIEAFGVPQTMTVGDSVRLQLKVTNTSDLTWIQKELGSLRIGNHWLDSPGELMVAQDDGRAVMPMVVPARSSFDGDLVITAPSQPGEYTLELDLVHEAVSWFNGKGSPTARYSIRVAAGEAPAKKWLPLREYALPDYGATLSLQPVESIASPPQDFPMFGVPKERVLEAVRDGGGQLIEIEDDPRAGHDWVSFRYFVRKPV